jgi:cell division protein DivIC
MKLNFLAPLFRNFYLSTLVLFVVWMILFDGNDVFTQIKNRTKLKKAQSDKQYYMEKIAQVSKDRKELMGTPELLEKFAREQYLMKKKSEQVFVVEAPN